MDPIVENLQENPNGYLTFQLNNINVSLANAIRRVILSDIPCVSFIAFPDEQNTINILANTFF